MNKKERNQIEPRYNRLRTDNKEIHQAESTGTTKYSFDCGITPMDRWGLKENKNG